MLNLLHIEKSIIEYLLMSLHGLNYQENYSIVRHDFNIFIFKEKLKWFYLSKFTISSIDLEGRLALSLWQASLDRITTS